MKKNFIVAFRCRTFSSISLLLLQLVLLGLYGCEKEETDSTTSSVTVFRPGYLDVESGLRITMYGNDDDLRYNIYYSNKGKIDYITTAGYAIDGRYTLNEKGDRLSFASDERITREGEDLEETWTLSYNAQGYLSGANGNATFYEGDEAEIIRVELSFTYDSNSHLTKMSVVDYEGSVIESTSISLSWENNLLQLAEISASYGGDGEMSSYSEKYKYYYDKDEYVNTYRQLTPCIEDYVELYMLGLFSSLGLLGVGPDKLPSKIDNIDYDSQGRERVSSHNANYLFNDNGAIIYSGIANSTYSYELAGK